MVFPGLVCRVAKDLLFQQPPVLVEVLLFQLTSTGGHLSDADNLPGIVVFISRAALKFIHRINRIDLALFAQFVTCITITSDGPARLGLFAHQPGLAS